MILFIYFVVVVMALSGGYEIFRNLRKPAVSAMVEQKTEPDGQPERKVKADVVTGVIFIICALVLAVFNQMFYGYVVGIAGILCIVFAED